MTDKNVAENDSVFVKRRFLKGLITWVCFCETDPPAGKDAPGVFIFTFGSKLPGTC